MTTFRELVQSLNPVMARSFSHGKLDIWDEYGRATTAPASGQWARKKQWGIQHYSDPTAIADGAEQQGTTGTLFVSMDPLIDFPGNGAHRLMEKRIATYMWRFYTVVFGGTYQVAMLGNASPTTVITSDWRGCRSLAVTFQEGAPVGFYCDGSFVGNSAANFSTIVVAAPIRVGTNTGGGEPCLTPIHLAGQFSQILTPKQISDLHEAFLVQPVDFRPSKRVIVPVTAGDSVETFGALINASGEIEGKNGISVGTQTSPVTHTQGTGYAEGEIVGHAPLGSRITLANPTTLLDPADGAFECVFRVNDTLAVNHLLASDANGAHRLQTTATGQLQAVINATTITTAAGVLRERDFHHAVATWWTDGATQRMELFLDGVSAGASTYTLGAAPTYVRELDAVASDGVALSLGRFYAGRVDSARARTLYVEAARAGGVLDNAEHIPPVTLANKTAGALGPWDIGSGTWSMVDDGAKRVLTNVSNGWAIRHCFSGCSAFGAWYWREIKGSGSSIPFVMPVASARDTWSGGNQDGYTMFLSSAESVVLYRVDAGALTSLFSTGTAYVTPGVEYEYFLTRRYDGLFVLYIRGGMYTTWTTVGSGTDTTYTTSHFWVAAFRTSDALSSLSHYPMGGTLLPGDVPGLED